MISSRRAATLAAAAILLCNAVIALVVRSVPAGVAFQPSEISVQRADFVRATNDHAPTAVAFFATDTLLAMSFLVLFVGLFAETRARAPRSAAAGILGGLVLVAFDLLENSFYLAWAIDALRGTPLIDPATARLEWITWIKNGGAVVAYLFFAIAMLARSRFARAVGAVMLAIALAVAASMAWPQLASWRGLAINLPIPLLLVWSWRPSPVSDRP